MIGTHQNLHENEPPALMEVANSEIGMEAVIMGLSRYAGYGALLVVLGFLIWVLAF